MVPKTFMLIAGEPSGDLLAAELVKALRQEITSAEAQPTSDLQPLHTSLEPKFFGAGGPRMADAGATLAFDMTAYAVFGVVDVIKGYGRFRRLFNQLRQLAIDRQPDVIICVDFSGFNRRFAKAIKKYVRARQGPFFDWDPKIVQYVSPQVWASRGGRAKQLERDVDLLLSIFPFEAEWYAARAPQLRVQFVGHPIIDRYASFRMEFIHPSRDNPRSPLVLLLPGSREKELKRHLPVMVEAAWQISARNPARFRMILPNLTLIELARACTAALPNLNIQAGGLPESLAEADLAIASSGTVTLECAYFGVPAVVLYKLSGIEYRIGKRLVKVKYIAMPNLLANEPLYPELIQHAANPENIAREALAFLNDRSRREMLKAKLAKVTQSLGPPGASQRAARAIVRLLCRSDGCQK
jgi:lipid-A-disaccharide synthase